MLSLLQLYLNFVIVSLSFSYLLLLFTLFLFFYLFIFLWGLPISPPPSLSENFDSISLFFFLSLQFLLMCLLPPLSLCLAHLYFFTVSFPQTLSHCRLFLTFFLNFSLVVFLLLLISLLFFFFYKL